MQPPEQRSPGEDAAFVDRGLETIGGSRPWFEQRLREPKITIHPASRLAEGLRELKALEQLAETQAVKRFSSAEGGQRWALDAVGTDYLTKPLHQGQLSGLLGFDDL